MKVWLAELIDYGCCSSEFIGVFSTKNKAQDYMKEKYDLSPTSHNLNIYSQIVDEPEE